MEIDPTIDPDKLKLPGLQGFEADQGTKNLLSEIISSVPGIDEAMTFAELMKSIQHSYYYSTVDSLAYDLTIFDTAPTGHTLRLLNFPNLLEKGLDKLVTLKASFQNITSSLSTMFGSQEEFDGHLNKMFGSIEKMKLTVTKVSLQMKDPV